MLKPAMRILEASYEKDTCQLSHGFDLRTSATVLHLSHVGTRHDKACRHDQTLCGARA